MESCPLCRSAIKRRSRPPEKDYIAQAIIDDLEVYCFNKRNFCTWTGPSSELEKHFSQCEFNQIPEWMKNKQKDSQMSTNEFSFEFHGDETDQEKERLNSIGGNQSLLQRVFQKTDSRTFVKDILDIQSTKKEESSKEIMNNDREAIMKVLMGLGSDSESEDKVEEQKTLSLDGDSMKSVKESSIDLRRELKREKPSLSLEGPPNELIKEFKSTLPEN